MSQEYDLNKAVGHEETPEAVSHISTSKQAATHRTEGVLEYARPPALRGGHRREGHGPLYSLGCVLCVPPQPLVAKRRPAEGRASARCSSPCTTADCCAMQTRSLQRSRRTPSCCHTKATALASSTSASSCPRAPRRLACRNWTLTAACVSTLPRGSLTVNYCAQVFASQYIEILKPLPLESGEGWTLKKRCVGAHENSASAQTLPLRRL